MTTGTTSPAPRRAALPGSGTAATVVALTTTLGLAAVCWTLTVRQMEQTNEMGTGAATGPGALMTFVAWWVPMTAAMMLPGAVPAVLGRARADGRVRTVVSFVAAYLAAWALVGIPFWALSHAHGSLAVGAVVVAAGAYELTPLKRRCRKRCRGSIRTGLGYGLACVGSGIGLMVVLVAVGAMSLTWMVVITVLVTAQKLVAPRAAVDVPVALAVVGLGAAVMLAPEWVPGFMPPM